MKRIHWHWTAGAPGINPKESDSYNFVITWPDGEVVPCVPVERQIPPLVNGAYAAHTRGANSYAIGIAVDAMADAQERPFRSGRYPITKKQIDALVALSADLGRKYKIPVTPETMLSHAEVQQTLGIRQNAKWDIMWLPGMTAPGDPITVGNKLRALVALEGKPPQRPENAPSSASKPVQRPKPQLGIGAAVAALLAALAVGLSQAWERIAQFFGG